MIKTHFKGLNYVSKQSPIVKGKQQSITLSNIKFKISDLQSEISKHAKSRTNNPYLRENQLHMLESADKILKYVL